MATIAYLRVSTDDQTADNQRLAIYKEGYKPDTWIEAAVSSRKTLATRRIDELLEKVQAGDLIVVTELSRLGRSVGQIAILVDKLLKKKVSLHCMKEGIKIGGAVTMDMNSKVMVTMFSLFGEIERDLISERTKEGLKRAVSEGKKLGRPAGPRESRFDARKDEIQSWLDMGVGIASIAKMCECSWPAMKHFITSRGMVKA